MKNDKLLSTEYMKDLINDSLFEHDLINQDIYLKCSKPKVVQDLPHDLRTTDLEKLNRRKEAIKIRIEELNLQISQKTLDVKVNNNEIKKLRLDLKKQKSIRKDADKEYKSITKSLKQDYKKQILPLLKKYEKSDGSRGYMVEHIKYLYDMLDKVDKNDFQSSFWRSWLDAPFYISTRNFKQRVGEISRDLVYDDHINKNPLAVSIGRIMRGHEKDWDTWRDKGTDYESANSQCESIPKSIDEYKAQNESIKKEIATLKTQRKQLKDEGKLTDNRISDTHDLAVPGDTYWDRENNTLYRVHDDGTIGSSPYYGPNASDHLYD